MTGETRTLDPQCESNTCGCHRHFSAAKHVVVVDVQTSKHGCAHAPDSFAEDACKPDEHRSAKGFEIHAFFQNHFEAQRGCPLLAAAFCSRPSAIHYCNLDAMHTEHATSSEAYKQVSQDRVQLACMSRHSPPERGTAAGSAGKGQQVSRRRTARCYLESHQPVPRVVPPRNQTHATPKAHASPLPAGLNVTAM